MRTCAVGVTVLTALDLGASCRPARPAPPTLVGVEPRAPAPDRMLDTEFGRYRVVGSKDAPPAVTVIIRNVLGDTVVLGPCGTGIDVTTRAWVGDRWAMVEADSVCPAIGGPPLLHAPGAILRYHVALPTSQPGTYVLELAAARWCTPASRPGDDGGAQGSEGVGSSVQPSCTSGDSLPLQIRTSRSFIFF
jgi:hypothetical protein